MEFKDSGKRIKIIIIFIIILMIPFVLYMRKEHRLSKSKQLYQKARSHEMAYNYKKAIEVLHEANGLNPNNPEIRTMMGELYLRTGQDKEGLDILNLVIIDFPHYPYPYYHIAFYYYHKEDYKKSREYWIAFSKINKDPIFDEIAKRRLAEIESFLKAGNEQKHSEEGGD